MKAKEIFRMAKTQHPADDIPNIEYDERIAALRPIERHLSAAIRGADLEIDRLRLESYFERHNFDPRNDRDRVPHEMLTALRKHKRSTADAAAHETAPGDLPNEVTAALRVSRGEVLVDAAPFAEQKAKLEKRRTILALGLGKVLELIRDRRDELSVELCRGLRKQHSQLLHAILDSCRDLVQKSENEMAFRARILQSGHECMGHILPSPGLGPPLALGNEADCGSAISTFRDRLEAHDRSVGKTK
jgi:hypothetical protein